jgi:hypothetical protein
LAIPSRSEAIVAKTVEDYALPESAVELVQQLPDQLVDELFAKSSTSATTASDSNCRDSVNRV